MDPPNWESDYPFKGNEAFATFIDERVVLDGVFSQDEILAIWRRFNQLKGTNDDKQVP